MEGRKSIDPTEDGGPGGSKKNPGAQATNFRCGVERALSMKEALIELKNSFPESSYVRCMLCSHQHAEISPRNPLPEKKDHATKRPKSSRVAR